MKIPERGLALLILLLQATRPLAEEELLTTLWTGEPVGNSALAKLIVRIRAVMPKVVRQSAGYYTLTLKRSDIDADLLSFFELDLHHAASEQLLSQAERAGEGCLVRFGDPWAAQLRQQVQRRLALIWLELAQRADRQGAVLSARDAYDRAQEIDPSSDLVTRAALQHALRSGDRAIAIDRYLRYQRAVDQELGVDPARDIDLLYRQALED